MLLVSSKQCSRCSFTNRFLLLLWVFILYMSCWLFVRMFAVNDFCIKKKNKFWIFIVAISCMKKNVHLFVIQQFQKNTIVIYTNTLN